ncbi:MAG TPA: substrate-binding domain-containing protein [Feifaniaceae bacterium]|nr:substrate-binding domain-containing protein [Feifaniaceae bacterium]
MKAIKKYVTLALGALLALSAFAGCAPAAEAPAAETPAAATEAPVAEAPAVTEAPAPSFDTTQDIIVVSREEGSGTRGAFIELMGVEVKDADGNKVDMTTVEAQITNDTAVMLTTVAGNPYGIGYVSLGSLNDTVKALQVDGVDATVENIKAGTYKVARPFNIATKGEVSAVAQDFINFILSAEGQEVVLGNKYIKVDDAAAAFAPAGVSGKLVVAGSSSITPLMEKLAEAYNAINANVTIEIQQSDSSTGMQAAIDGTCDIGMASRELKDSELSEGLTPTVIAIDGIAVITNNENPLTGLTADQIRAIFVGEVLTWSEVA